MSQLLHHPGLGRRAITVFIQPTTERTFRQWLWSRSLVILVDSRASIIPSWSLERSSGRSTLGDGLNLAYPGSCCDHAAMMTYAVDASLGYSQLQFHMLHIAFSFAKPKCPFLLSDHYGTHFSEPGRADSFNHLISKTTSTLIPSHAFLDFQGSFCRCGPPVVATVANLLFLGSPSTIQIS
ncbi:hypothetical protein BCR34DRAFT_382787 [Clohesyomyces aquaticus]|uniref:Uncharacterized protein n=1 Tax=Clohesyomyces aquaticus TaxID=1231657 RepID=A0A1Y1ZFN1_9PLEO|nr:hypothetical protein BCR34DRAFT_382787 [Clohesyomyces aquaticus]